LVDIFVDRNILPWEDIAVQSSMFAALADPNRFQIVEILRDGPASVGEIAERLVLRQPQTSKHLRTLADAGLVRVQAVAQRRVYELRPEPFEQLDRWIALYRPTLEERLDSMQRYLRRLRPPTPDTPAKKEIPP
jgi:DNA-binding transcriptional ArsR family regulator